MPPTTKQTDFLAYGEGTKQRVDANTWAGIVEGAASMIAIFGTTEVKIYEWLDGKYVHSATLTIEEHI